jgi:hypothetical protein
MGSLESSKSVANDSDWNERQSHGSHSPILNPSCGAGSVASPTYEHLSTCSNAMRVATSMHSGIVEEWC